MGLLTRRVLPAQVVHPVPPPRGKPKPPKEPKTRRVVEILRKIIEWRHQLDTGEVPIQAAVVRREGVTSARVTQILMLLELAPEIQERMLCMPKSANRPRISERALRPVARLDARRQRATFDAFLD